MADGARAPLRVNRKHPPQMEKAALAGGPSDEQIARAVPQLNKRNRPLEDTPSMQDHATYGQVSQPREAVTT